jgi:hypothetical protein
MRRETCFSGTAGGQHAREDLDDALVERLAISLLQRGRALRDGLAPVLRLHLVEHGAGIRILRDVVLQQQRLAHGTRNPRERERRIAAAEALHDVPRLFAASAGRRLADEARQLHAELVQFRQHRDLPLPALVALGHDGQRIDGRIREEGGGFGSGGGHEQNKNIWRGGSQDEFGPGTTFACATGRLLLRGMRKDASAGNAIPIWYGELASG